MLNRATLEKMPKETLDKLADALGQSLFVGGPRAHLIEVLLETEIPRGFDLKPYLPVEEEKLKIKPELKEAGVEVIWEKTEVEKEEEKDESSVEGDDNSVFVKAEEPEKIPVENPKEQVSTFIKPEDHTEVEGSTFVKPEDATSQFIKPEDVASQFVKPEDGVSSFIKPEDQPSAFIKPGDDQSSFVSPENSPSVFISQNQLGDAVAGNDGKNSRIHGLGPGDRIILHDRPYDITRIISQTSREAVIYQIRNTDGRTLALKLYKEHRSPAEEPNAEALRRIQLIDNKDILRLHSFGTGDKKYQQKYCFEICDFAHGGNLLQVDNFREWYSLSFVEQTLIPEIFRGMKALHAKEIYHCDLKPQNILYLDKNRTDLVIGDYGSSKTFEEQSGRSAQQFDSVIGTNAYMAPEQANRIISPKVDYYAFGMILLHLVYPEYFTKDDDFTVVDRRKSSEIRENQYAQEKVLPFNPDPAYRRINQLIGGLTLYNHHERWGAVEVEKWLNGGYVEVNYKGQSLIRPINIGYTSVPVIRSPEDLIRAIELFPDRWYGDMVEDQTGFNSLLDWFASRRDLQVKKIFEQMIRYYKPYGKDYVGEAILRYFDPERKVRLGDQAFDIYDHKDLRSVLGEYFTLFDEKWKSLSIQQLRFSLFQLEFALRQSELSSGDQVSVIRHVLEQMGGALGIGTAEGFQNYRTVFQDHLGANPKSKTADHEVLRRYLLLIYMFTAPRPFKDLENNPINKLEDLGYFFALNKELFDNPYLQLEKDFFLDFQKRRDLIGVGYADFLFGVFEGETQTRIDLKKVKVNKDRVYTAEYSYQKSLNNFLQKQNINRELMEGGKQIVYHQNQQKWFQFAPAVFKDFMAGVQEKHNLPDKVIIPENKKKLRREYILKGTLHNIKLHLQEFVAAICLVLPLTGIVGSFVLGENGGLPLIGQLYQMTDFNNYVENPEKYYSDTQGFFIILIAFAVMYLLALIPKLWARHELEIIGEVRPSTPRWLSINGGYGFAFLAFMTAFPFLLVGVNWLYELIGLAGWFAIVFGLWTMNTKGTGRSKSNMIAAMMAIAGLVRLGFEIWSWYEMDKRSEPIPFRGLIDVGFYLVAMVIFFIPPIYYQMFRAHHTIQLLIKYLLVAMVAGLILLDLKAGKESWSIEDFGFAGNHTQHELTIPNVYFARVADGFEAMTLRAGPSGNSDPKEVVNAGDIFKVEQGEENTWWPVVLCGNVEGYMYFDKITLLTEVTPSQLNLFLNGGGPCQEGGIPGQLISNENPLLPRTNYSGQVGKLDASFLLNVDAESRINGSYYYPERSERKIYQLIGNVLPDNKLELFEYTGNQQTATCKLVFNSGKGCYLGQMSNTDGRKLDIRICGDKFDHSISQGSSSVPGDYPEASIRMLTERELKEYSQEELQLMRNEIFARHGYIFKSGDIQNYFETQSWYQDIPKLDQGDNGMTHLTDFEKANVSLITSIENDRNRNTHRTGRIKGNNVNIRDNPSTDGSTVISRLNNGERVLILDTSIQSDGNSLVTLKKTSIEMTDGTVKTLQKGKALFMEDKALNLEGRYYVGVNLSGKIEHGYVARRDVSSTRGKAWYKIRFGANQEGWVYQDFIRD